MPVFRSIVPFRQLSNQGSASSFLGSMASIGRAISSIARTLTARSDWMAHFARAARRASSDSAAASA